MNRIETITTEFEVLIGDLLCVCQGTIQYNHSIDVSNGSEPAEESVSIMRAIYDSAVYYLNGDSASEIDALDYYKDYTSVKYEERLPKHLKELCQIHCNIIADAAVEMHIQEN